MADEKTDQQAKSPAKTDTVLVRLLSSGADDSFLIGDPEKGGLAITPAGVEIPAAKVDDMIEIADYNGVALSIEPVEKGK